MADKKKKKKNKAKVVKPVVEIKGLTVKYDKVVLEDPTWRAMGFTWF